jgi:uncharacterized damage-inducible protein DinB
MGGGAASLSTMLPMDPLKIYDYLVKSRERVFDAVRPLTPQQHRQPFAIGLKTIGSTLTHIMISEWYYIERLEGRAVPPYEQWAIRYDGPTPPAFEAVERIWREQADRIRAVIASESEKGDWTRKITWLSFPDDTRGNKRFHITCTAGDLVTQLALHEVHHRAQLMAMLRELGAPPLEDLDYNALMYERVEATEGMQGR